MAQLLKLETIRLDGGTQPRLGIDWDVAYSYGELMADGVKLPPVTVFYDGESYWLADGFHRYHGAFSADLEEVSADVIQGTLEDAQWFSLGANKSHGLMRSNDDKQRAVQAALRHPKCAGMSDRAIAKHVGVSHQTVSGWRSRICQTLTDSQPAAKPTPTRTATRNGTTYEINTSNIGKSRADTQPTMEAGAQPTPPPNQPEPAPTPQPEPRESDDLRTFEYHLRGILETQLTDRLLADEIIASPAATQILSLMERVHELLANVQSRAAARC